MRYSIDRPAMELLYLPLPPALKLPAKSFIDTVAWRAGDGLAGLAVMAFVTFGGLAPEVPEPRHAARDRALAAARLPRAPPLRRDARGEPAAAPARRRARHRPRSTTARRPRCSPRGLGAVDPKEILYALDLLGAGRQASAAHPAVRGLLDHADADVRRRALSLLSEAGDLSVAAARRGAAARPRRRGAHRGAALPLAPRARRPALARPGPRGLPRVLGALGRGRGARAARRRAARGGRAAVRRDGGRARRAGAAHAARGGAARRARDAAVPGAAAAAGAGRGRRGGAHRDPRRGARTRPRSSTC